MDPSAHGSLRTISALFVWRYRKGRRVTIKGVPDPGQTPAPQIDEMQELLQRAERFASIVREELDELSSSRDALLAAVERDGDERRREAAVRAKTILADAERRAGATLDEAARRAAEINAAARTEHRRLVTINAQYRATLSETLDALAELPEIPAEPPEAEADVDSPPRPQSTLDAAHRFRRLANETSNGE